MATPFETKKTATGATLAVRGSLDINSCARRSPRRSTGSSAASRRRSRSISSGLDLIDSSGVAALVKLYKGVRGVGGTVTIVGARDQPLAIFKLLRMDKVFNL